jgi:FMN-dependent NADH-azoreductase
MLYIAASPAGGLSNVRQLSDEFLEEFKRLHPDVTVITKDLTKDPVPHLDGPTLEASFTRNSERVEYQRRIELIKEIVSADYITVSTSTHNNGPPSVLKAYIDQIVLPGVFDMHGKALRESKVTLMIASDLVRQPETRNSTDEASEEPVLPATDHCAAYLKQLFDKLGAVDLKAIYVDLAENVTQNSEVNPRTRSSTMETTVSEAFDRSRYAALERAKAL